jgi:hypothetical protein
MVGDGAETIVAAPSNQRMSRAIEAQTRRVHRVPDRERLDLNIRHRLWSAREVLLHTRSANPEITRRHR